MKKFFKYLFVTFSGTLLGLIFFFLILAGIIGGIIASKTSTVTIKDKSVLVIRLHEPILEVSTYNPFSSLSPFSNNKSVIGLRDVLHAISEASTNPNIKGIVLYTEMIQSGYSTVNEIREALITFKKSGKFIYSYGDVYSQKSYLLASVSDKIYANPEGMFELTGITSQFVSYKNLLEKIGIKPVVFRCGKYKSFVEPFTSEKMSAENKEQVTALIQNIWGNFVTNIEKARYPLKTTISTIADSLLVWDARSAYDFGLVDSLVYYDEFTQIIKQKIGIPKTDAISFVSLQNYIQYTLEKEATNDETKTPQIAVIVAAGGINLGKGDENSIGSETVSKYIRDARLDKSVKGIVLRINSGGGSALASEAIWREMKLAADTKPTIVSMGDVAASGGYYIAAPAHVIVANPTTITGSIGVFGMLINSEDLLKKIGVSIDTVKSSNYSDIGSPIRPISDYETMIITKGIDKTYDLFKKRVAEGRKMPISKVEKIAQGRVWSGTDALKIGLVDTLGDISVAITIAAKKAGIYKSYSVKNIPEAKSQFDQVMDMLSNKEVVANEIHTMLGDEFSSLFYLLKEVPREKGIYMQLPYILKIQ